MKALIIDDELPISKNLKFLIEKHINAIKEVEIENEFEKAIENLENNNYDILFLDVELGKKTGFDLLNLINNRNFHLVVTTAHATYALQAIKLSAIDFLLKPIDINELKATVNKIIASKFPNTELNHQLNNLNDFITNDIKRNKKIVLKTQDSISIHRLDEVVRLESQVNYTLFHFREQKNKLISKPLKEYDEMLSDFGFFRSHKSHLINLEHFMSFEKRDGGYIKMSDNSSVPISVRKKELLLSVLENLK